MRPRLHIDGVVGFTGTLDVDVDTGSDFSGDDLSDTWGARVGIEWPVIEILSLGIEAGYRNWEVADQNLDRNHVIEGTFIPRLRLPLEGEVVHGALTLGVPFTLGASILDGNTRENLANETGLDGVGAALGTGIRAGAQLFLTERFGLNAEVGYEAQWFRHNLDPESDAAWLRVNQVIVMAGISLGF